MSNPPLLCWATSRESRFRSGAAGTQTSACMGCCCLKQRLNLLCYGMFLLVYSFNMYMHRTHITCVLFFFKCWVICLKEKVIKLRKRVRNGAIIHLMVHDPNGHNNCDWARSKWGTHPSLPLKGRSLSISAVLGCVVRRCVSRELGRQDLNIMPCLPCSCLCPWGIESRTHR